MRSCRGVKLVQFISGFLCLATGTSIYLHIRLFTITHDFLLNGTLDPLNIASAAVAALLSCVVISFTIFQDTLLKPDPSRSKRKGVPHENEFGVVIGP